MSRPSPTHIWVTSRGKGAWLFVTRWRLLRAAFAWKEFRL